jgi:hypothetical protein
MARMIIGDAQPIGSTFQKCAQDGCPYDNSRMVTSGPIADVIQCSICKLYLIPIEGEPCGEFTDVEQS